MHLPLSRILAIATVVALLFFFATACDGLFSDLDELDPPDGSDLDAGDDGDADADVDSDSGDDDDAGDGGDAGDDGDAGDADVSCEPESDDELCINEDRDCGSLEVTDRCGAERNVNCNLCGEGFVCDNEDCIECEEDEHVCDNKCVSKSDLDHCGECDNECDGNQFCDGDDCVLKECDSAADCGGSDVCHDHKCVDCINEQDCSIGLKCNDAGECVECIASDDCPEDHVCDDGECVEGECATDDDCAHESNCPVCFENQCRQCVSDSHCAANDNDNICRTFDTSGDVGFCVECTSDSHCEDDEECCNGSCQPSNLCGGPMPTDPCLGFGDPL